MQMADTERVANAMIPNKYSVRVEQKKPIATVCLRHE